MKKMSLTARALLYGLSAVVFYALPLFLACSKSTEPEPSPADPIAYSYAVQDVYPHDEAAFTQGLVYIDSTLYEGTGITGQSTLRRVVLESGTVVQSRSLAPSLFGEGIVVLGDRIVQLTWLNGTAIVWDRDTFDSLGTYHYTTQGWGITTDGNRFIVSDGTDTLYFRDTSGVADSTGFTLTGRIAVHDGSRAVTLLNELEYIDGRVYANVWRTDSIAVINPVNGVVTAWIDLTGLLETEGVYPGADVLNGIAYDGLNDRLLVTGKYWPHLFHIDLVEVR